MHRNLPWKLGLVKKMGEQSSSGAFSLSTSSLPSAYVPVGITFGRAPPKFGRAPPPSTTAPPSIVPPHVSPPPTPYIIAPTQNVYDTQKIKEDTRPPKNESRRIYEKEETLPPVTNREIPIVPPRPQQNTVPASPNSSFPSASQWNKEWPEDKIIAFIDEDGTVAKYCKEEWRENGFTDEKIKAAKQEMDDAQIKRRSRLASSTQLMSLRERRTRDEGDFLLSEFSEAASTCELMMQEGVSKRLIRSFEQQEMDGVGTLIKLMMKDGTGPVKMSEWAEYANIDEYYLKTYAREVCEMLLPRGIVRIKDGNFVMGELLGEYIHLFKTVYTQELMVLLDRGDTISEKVISEDLGVDSLMNSLSMEWSSTAFIVEKRGSGDRKEVYVTLRL